MTPSLIKKLVKSLHRTNVTGTALPLPLLSLSLSSHLPIWVCLPSQAHKQTCILVLTVSFKLINSFHLCVVWEFSSVHHKYPQYTLAFTNSVFLNQWVVESPLMDCEVSWEKTNFDKSICVICGFLKGIFTSPPDADLKLMTIFDTFSY